MPSRSGTVLSERPEPLGGEAPAAREGRNTPLMLRLLPVPLAIVGMVCLGHGLMGTNPWVHGLLTVATAYMMFCWTSTFHETAHQTLWKTGWLNVAAGRMLGTMMFVPYTLYRENHIRHHAYLNRQEDWELWPYSDGTTSLSFRRLYVWFDLFLGILSAALIYSRMYWHRSSPIRTGELQRTIGWEYLAIAVFWSVTWGAVSWLGQWPQHLAGVLVPLSLAGMLQTGRKLTEHLGMASYDPLHGTRTVVPKKWLVRICSYLNFDIFVHGPHHRHPRAAHHTLRGRMESYVRGNPGVDYPVYETYGSAVRAMLPSLFLNPGCGVNAGGSQSNRLKNPDIQDFVYDVVTDVAVEPTENTLLAGSSRDT